MVCEEALLIAKVAWSAEGPSAAFPSRGEEPPTEVPNQYTCQRQERLAPPLGLRLRARYAEWRAMGWL